MLGQLEGILRASVHGPLRIMLPMVGSVEELRQARGMLEDVKNRLRAADVQFDPHVKLGLMIELPSAVWIAESETKLAGWMPVDCLDVETLPNSNRLLTGTLAESHETLAAWRWTNAPRHGKVAVPVSDGNKGQRLAYVVREYRGSAPGDAGKDGNKIVVEERIIEIMAVGGEL